MLMLSTFRATSPESAADDVEQPVADQLLAVRVGLVEAVAAVGGDHADGNQIVDTPDQNLERVVAFDLGLSAFGLARVPTAARSGVPESSSEQAWFGQREVDVALPGGA